MTDRPGRALQRLIAFVLAAIVSALTLAVLDGHQSWSGRVIWEYNPRHGLHAGDLLVLGAWLVAMVACGVLWWRRPR